MINRIKRKQTGIGIKFNAIAFIFILPVLYVLHQKSIISGGMTMGIGGAFFGALFHSVLRRCFSRDDKKEYAE